MVKPKIACYITGGWTECRAMTQFLEKNNKLMYSKKGEGINMLLNLNPDKVAEICGHYFVKTYHELREFHME